MKFSHWMVFTVLSFLSLESRYSARNLSATAVRRFAKRMDLLADQYSRSPNLEKQTDFYKNKLLFSTVPKMAEVEEKVLI